MRILLDTNIVIHRENRRISNYSIGHLFRWIDKLKHDKVIHPYTIDELKKYRDPETQEVLSVKLDAYNIIKTVQKPSSEFLDKVSLYDKNINDAIDNCLLYELYSGRVDAFITEDRKLRNKAISLRLANRVFSINSFIDKVSSDNPDLIEYKALSVEKTCFGQIDVGDSFFDSFRDSYDDFNSWFARKCDEDAYICRADEGQILGFLYLKTEDSQENYSDIQPLFTPKKRLKVGTFKVESTGFRLGERFVKIIFDNAQKRKVDEIYVTLYNDRDELKALEELLYRWGFVYWGTKRNNGLSEKVLVKHLGTIANGQSPKQNYPNISSSCNKFILPIMAKYHTSLLPDSQLNTEDRINFLEKTAYRYALQKVYISWAPTNGAKPGDLFLFYRMAKDGEVKKYKSVITTIALVDEIIDSIQSEENLLSLCQNRSVFTVDELKKFWRDHNRDLKIIKFIFVKSLNKRPTLSDLRDMGIIDASSGPRPFTRITDAEFHKIIAFGETDMNYAIEE